MKADTFFMFTPFDFFHFSDVKALKHPSRCGFADHHTKGLKVIEVSELQKIPVQQCPISLIISLISIREISKSSDTTTVLVAELCSGPCPSKYINSPSGSPHV